jgi:hypothetical protein
MKPHHYTLVVISKAFTENVDSTRVFCVVINSNLQTDGMMFIQTKI